MPELVNAWRGDTFYRANIALMVIAAIAIGVSAMQFCTHLHFTITGWYPNSYHSDSGYVAETHIDLTAYATSLILATWYGQSALWLVMALLGLMFHTGYMAGMALFPNWFHDKMTHLDRGRQMKFRGWWGVVQRSGAGTDTLGHCIGLSMSSWFVVRLQAPVYITVALAALCWGLAAYRSKFWPRQTTT
jgi:hypothetical protein